MTKTEFLATKAGLNPHAPRNTTNSTDAGGSGTPSGGSTTPTPTTPTTVIPDAINWVALGKVAPIKEQGHVGGWAPCMKYSAIISLVLQLPLVMWMAGSGHACGRTHTRMCNPNPCARVVLMYMPCVCQCVWPQCGSCWTFAATAAIESATAIADPAGALYSLAEQQVRVFCTRAVQLCSIEARRWLWLLCVGTYGCRASAVGVLCCNVPACASLSCAVVATLLSGVMAIAACGHLDA